MPRTKAEEAFIDQFTRKLLVEWARQTIAFGLINNPTKADIAQGTTLYFEHAKERGWVGKSEPPKLTAKGFAAAAAFLKR